MLGISETLWPNAKRDATETPNRSANRSSDSNDGALIPRSIRLRKSTQTPMRRNLITASPNMRMPVNS